MKTIPDWYIDLVDSTRPALQAFRIEGNHCYDMPVCFFYISNGEDWYDWDDGICDIPVYNASWNVYVAVAQDEECPLFPVWRGEMTPKRESMLREFQLRFAKTGDY